MGPKDTLLEQDRDSRVRDDHRPVTKLLDDLSAAREPERVVGVRSTSIEVFQREVVRSSAFVHERKVDPRAKVRILAFHVLDDRDRRRTFASKESFVEAQIVKQR
ncbi:MAG TPA: hypothetical protein VGU66_04510 [Candidatus Elarobacter sp.]|nr:hypothetical protein [Candidatus Elarobacter sp.]